MSTPAVHAALAFLWPPYAITDSTVTRLPRKTAHIPSDLVVNSGILTSWSDEILDLSGIVSGPNLLS